MVELAGHLPVRPVGEGVHGGSQWHRDEDEQEVAQGQADDQYVGHVSHHLGVQIEGLREEFIKLH